MEWEWTVVLYLNVSFNLQQNQELEDGSRPSEKLYRGRVHLIKLIPYVSAESLLTVSFTLHVLPYTKSAPSNETILFLRKNVKTLLCDLKNKRSNNEKFVNDTSKFVRVRRTIYIFRIYKY